MKNQFVTDKTTVIAIEMIIFMQLKQKTSRKTWRNKGREVENYFQ
jgi:hypothetical protein